jgi:hypothetical protein
MKFTATIAIALATFGLATSSFAAEQTSFEPVVKYYGSFYELPAGAVQPRGWVQQWLERQAQGLTGHPENLSYPYDTCMYAGLIPPPAVKGKWWKEWWPYEQSAYFVDATVRLSHLIDDPGISARRDANIKFMVEHSTGTNLGGSRASWPNAVVGRALMAEYSATGNPRVKDILQNWLLTSSDLIAQGGRNGVNFEEAFYLYGLTGDQRLLDLCKRIYDGYLHDTNSFFTLEKIQGKGQFHEHGVTAAEELKCLPLMYSYTGDEKALQLAKRAYGKVLDNNLMPDGGIVSAEHLEPTSFYSVHESCDITDWSWSLGYLFMATGDPKYADLIERTTFNALPGAVTKDFKQLQYFSAANQVVIGPTNSHTGHWVTRMTYRAAHDTECCAGNINRAMPNYVMRMWMRGNDDTLAAVYYGPCELTTTVSGQPVVITEETDYPFRDSIAFKIKTSKPVTFDLRLRIPQWCQEASMDVNGNAMIETRNPTRAGTFASIRQEFHDGDVVHLKLPMEVRVENWLKDQSVCVARGPLVFSVKIDEKRIEHTNDAADVRPFLDGHEIRGFPEVEFQPQSDWRYGFDAEMKNRPAEIKVVESAMTGNPFIEAQTPVRLEAPMYALPDWAITNGVKRAEPAGLPNTKERETDGKSTQVTLVPYGATHLRLTTVPVVD